MSQHRRAHALRSGAVLATAGILVLAGCSGGGGESSGSEGSGDKSFSFAFGISNQVETGYEVLANKYMEENPDVDITINALPADNYPQTLRTQLQAGNSSDIFVTLPGTGQAASTLTLAEAGLLAPLGEASTGIIPDGFDALFTLDGETYGQALDLVVQGNVFNSLLGDETGVEYPSDWDGVLAACEAARSNDKSLFVAAGTVPQNSGIIAQIIAATRVYADDRDWNQKRIDGETTFAESEGWQDTLQAIIDLNDAGCFQDGVEGAGFDAITNGLVQTGSSLAMFGPSGAATELGKAAGEKAKFEMRAFPPVNESDQAIVITNANYALSLAKGSADNAAASAFLEWMAEPAQLSEFATYQGNLPVQGIEDVDLSETPFAPVSDLIADGNSIPIPNTTWSNPAVYDALGTGVQGLLTGQKSVDQVLQEMDAAWG